MGIYIVAVIFFVLICLVIFFAERYRKVLNGFRLSEEAIAKTEQHLTLTEQELIQKKSELGRLEIKVANYRKVLESLRGCQVDPKSIEDINATVFVFADENISRLRNIAAKALEDN